MQVIPAPDKDEWTNESPPRSISHFNFPRARSRFFTVPSLHHSHVGDLLCASPWITAVMQMPVIARDNLHFTVKTCLFPYIRGSSSSRIGWLERRLRSCVVGSVSSSNLVLERIQLFIIIFYLCLCRIADHRSAESGGERKNRLATVKSKQTQ